MSEAVRGMFDALARRYDRGNDLLSFGLHRRWKHAAARLALSASQPGRPFRLLDCACGSGDILLAAWAQYPRFPFASFEGIGLDFAPEMLEVARQRALRGGDAQEQRLRFVHGDALDLQFKDGEFDAATIGFGIRNVDDPALCLREMARVVRPGGHVVVLETGQPANSLWRAIYRAYGHLIMEPLGGLSTGQRSAYRYLNETAARFPCGPAFLEIMRATRIGEPGPAGQAFSSVRGWPLLGGIAWLYLAVSTEIS